MMGMQLSGGNSYKHIRSLLYTFTIISYMQKVCLNACTIACIWRSHDNLKKLFLFAFWVPDIELKSTGFLAGAFAVEASHWPHKYIQFSLVNYTLLELKTTTSGVLDVCLTCVCIA